jgi:Flp pilus assembly protein TadD
MRIALSSPVRRGAFLIGCAALLLLAWALCLQFFVAHLLESSGGTANLERAARLQPMNAEIPEKLGIVEMSAGSADFQHAVLHLERSVALNPHSSRAWLNLANAYAVIDDGPRREDAVRHALQAEPKDTQVQWEAANLFVITDLERSLQLLRGVVENDPHYAPAAIQVAYSASNNDINKAMMAIPLMTPSRLQLMRWLLERNQFDAADRVWPTVLAAPGTVNARDTFFYFDSLIARRQVDRAASAWASVIHKDPTLNGRVQVDNLVLNGDFEGDLLNGGFGWRYAPTAGVNVTLDTSTFHGGTRSLALQVDGDNLQDFGVRELIRVEPGKEYRLSGWLHGEELEAAHGISVAVSDAYSHFPLLLTDNVLGSFPWRQVEGSFTIPPETTLVEISFRRSPSNGRIRGRLWIDDLRIEKK